MKFLKAFPYTNFKDLLTNKAPLLFTILKKKTSIFLIFFVN
ncbi:hypothetical protein RCH33_1450 [Flavobacterium daejeonense]|nr:hypothetical protein RCH33_1450 [Flavobacterium daejeonense]